MDVVDISTRSKMMSGIKGSNTRPEMTVRRYLHSSGFRFRLHRKDLPGRPDIILSKYRLAIFVHGCFWHAHQGCKYFKVPKTRPDFWAAKLQANINRDHKSVDALVKMGWRVLCVWECATRDHKTCELLGNEMVHWINSNAPLGEIGGPLISIN